jgi:hypothetical protein
MCQATIKIVAFWGDAVSRSGESQHLADAAALRRCKRALWDTTDLDWQPLKNRRTLIGSCDLPESKHQICCSRNLNLPTQTLVAAGGLSTGEFSRSRFFWGYFGGMAEVVP